MKRFVSPSGVHRSESGMDCGCISITGQLLAYGTKRRRRKNTLPRVLVKGRPHSPPLALLAGVVTALEDFFFPFRASVYHIHSKGWGNLNDSTSFILQIFIIKSTDSRMGCGGACLEGSPQEAEAEGLPGLNAETPISTSPLPKHSHPQITHPRENALVHSVECRPHWEVLRRW